MFYILYTYCYLIQIASINSKLQLSFYDPILTFMSVAGGSRYRNRRRFISERSRTPGRSTRSSPARKSRRTSPDSDEKITSLKLSHSSSSSSDNIFVEQKSSHEGTLVGTLVSSSKTVKSNEKLEIEVKNNNDSDSLELSDKVSDDESISDNDDKLLKDNKVIPASSIVKPQIVSKIYEKISEPKIENDNLSIKDFKENEVDEPSFANTLDGIETLKTNEVADIDPSSQALDDRPSSPEIQLHDLDNIPVLKYIDQSDEENVKNETTTIKKIVKPNTEKVTLNYEDIKKSLETQQPPDINESLSDIEDQDNIYQPVSTKQKQSFEEDLKELAVIPKDVILTDSSSTSSSSSPRRNRFTPISFSSSEALFFSPPDSPQLSEKLRKEIVTQVILSLRISYLAITLIF